MSSICIKCVRACPGVVFQRRGERAPPPPPPLAPGSLPAELVSEHHITEPSPLPSSPPPTRSSNHDHLPTEDLQRQAGQPSPPPTPTLLSSLQSPSPPQRLQPVKKPLKSIFSRLIRSRLRLLGGEQPAQAAARECDIREDCAERRGSCCCRRQAQITA